ncbi:MAG: hypothetical protein N2036_00615 [Bryobacteraceae bacterium]|nr:hypothetical protein [Bryobacteraceae bacterium]MCX7602554.1 hypothetical protein [Bryobacteraceae bacterium]
MRAAVVLLCAALACTGCRRARHPHPELTVEEPAELRAEIDATNPADEGQLLDGFYPREPQGWRWSAPQFTVTLAAPPEARGREARLEMEFVIPDVAAAALEGVSIAAVVDGRPLEPWRAPGAGRHTAVFRVPAEAMREEAVIVDFSLDRFLAPPGDSRRLGVIPVRFRLAAAGAK